MSRTKKPRADASDSSPDAPASVARRVALHLIVASLLAVACGVAFRYMRTYVDQTAAGPTTPPKVVFKNRPPWMTDVLADQLARSFRPADAKSVFDHNVLVQTSARLAANPWVAKVNQVRRAYGSAPGDTIEVDCDFRAPMALVKSGNDWWFVDAQCVKLPESFREADVPKVVFGPGGRPNIRQIDGVRWPAPRNAGGRWPGDDLAAGLDLVRRLSGQPFADDIVRVNVDNFAGRVDPREAQIVLVTRFNTQVRWGRPWAATDAFIEVRPEMKVARLRAIVRDYGRVDAKYPWIDIRFDKMGFPLLGSDPTTAQTAGAQEGAR